jgi:hypothetical protein
LLRYAFFFQVRALRAIYGANTSLSIVGIAALTGKAEAADAGDEIDPQALPREIARREVLKAKLDEAVARLEGDAKAEYDAQLPAYQSKKAAYDEKAKKGKQRGTAPVPPDDEPPPSAQINLTDPDSALMGKSNAHEYRQSYNGQAVVDADGSQLILHADVITTPSDHKSFVRIILGMAAPTKCIGLPETVSADAGYACGKQVKILEDAKIKPFVAIGRTMIQRPYDFRPPPGGPGGSTQKPPKAVKDPDESSMGVSQCKPNWTATREKHFTKNENKQWNLSSVLSNQISALEHCPYAAWKRSKPSGSSSL